MYSAVVLTPDSRGIASSPATVLSKREARRLKNSRIRSWPNVLIGAIFHVPHGVSNDDMRFEPLGIIKESGHSYAGDQPAPLSARPTSISRCRKYSASTDSSCVPADTSSSSTANDSGRKNSQFSLRSGPLDQRVDWWSCRLSAWAARTSSFEDARTATMNAVERGNYAAFWFNQRLNVGLVQHLLQNQRPNSSSSVLDRIVQYKIAHCSGFTDVSMLGWWAL